MDSESPFRLSTWRGLALACVVVSGLVSIVGSGGGVQVEGCLLGPCPGDFPAEPAAPSIEPPSATVQVGGTVVFSARAPGIGNPSYQWTRAPRGFSGGPFIDIPGATGATYTLAGAQLVDDDSAFSVSVQGSFNGRQVAVTSLPARLAVSSMPGVVFQDTEFLPADWAAAASVTPLSNGPTHSVERATTGGNPGAYRKVSITMTAGPSRLDVFNTFQASSYNPASQGPIYLIDFALDCIALPGLLGVGPTLLIEQDGRRYIGGSVSICGSTTWGTAPFPIRHGAASFLRVDGPTCTVGDSCPNFAATGKPIRFGFANGNEMLPGVAGVSGGFGVDNWKVTVWRR
jgi:hypothetical protein